MRDHLRPPPWTRSWLASGLQLLATHLCSLRTAPAMLWAACSVGDYVQNPRRPGRESTATRRARLSMGGRVSRLAPIVYPFAQ